MLREWKDSNLQLTLAFSRILLCLIPAYPLHQLTDFHSQVPVFPGCHWSDFPGPLFADGFCGRKQFAFRYTSNLSDNFLVDRTYCMSAFKPAVHSRWIHAALLGDLANLLVTYRSCSARKTLDVIVKCHLFDFLSSKFCCFR